MADEPADPNADLKTQIERAKLEKDLAVAEKEKAEAERDELAAKLPKSEAKGPAGNVTLKEGAGYFGEIQAYRTLTSAAESVSKAVDDKVRGKTVVLSQHSDLVTSDRLWRVIDLKLTDFDARFEDLTRRFTDDAGNVELFSPQGGLLVALPAILGAASEVAAFFRVDRELIGRQVTLSVQALLAETATKLTAKRVILPSLQLRAEPSELIKKLGSVQAKRRAAVELRERVRSTIKPDAAEAPRIQNQLTKLDAKLEELKKAGGNQTEIKKLTDEIDAQETKRDAALRRVDQWEQAKAQFDLVVSEFGTFETTLTTRPAGQNTSPLEAVAIVDTIRSAGDDVYLLYVDIVSQGSETEITKTAWTSGRISYIGGSVVTYFLANGKSGDLEASGMLPNHLASSFKGGRGAESMAETP
jgi:hypothetical protein